MSEKTIQHIDEKANKIKGFDLISNFMWRRAFYLAKENFKKNEKIMVIDGCAGGGKLISCMNKSWSGKAYEPNYAPYMYANYMLDQENFDVNVVNEPFEFHFTTPSFQEFHFAISIPYIDRQVNICYEMDKDNLKMKNYAYYVISRSLDVVQSGGFGIFAIHKELMDLEYFKDEIKNVAEKSNILSSEGYENYVILILKKK
jgi:hypothetical protein